ncbi:hypothetical protein PT974_12590 [Cladobotryum mycophilum]|uniref:SnoaL-like domain-containing protein n=1 Tax=Cladobotryum mycophilum TaxID=491253 RepID=A0ABR0S8F2_9HYPO
MTLPESLSPVESRDRLAIRQLIDRYAQCADRRLAEEQMALFTHNAHFMVFMGGQGQPVTQELHTREDLRPVFEALRAYTHTMHFNGHSTMTIGADGNTASGESYCIAHHIIDKDGQRTVFVAHLRYHDVVKKQADGAWLFAERKLFLDWSESRPINS